MTPTKGMAGRPVAETTPGGGGRLSTRQREDAAVPLTRRQIGRASLGLAGAAGVLPYALAGCTSSTGGNKTAPVTRVRIDATPAFAAVVGVDYELAPNWLLNVDAKKILLRPDVSVLVTMDCTTASMFLVRCCSSRTSSI